MLQDFGLNWMCQTVINKSGKSSTEMTLSNGNPQILILPKLLLPSKLSMKLHHLNFRWFYPVMNGADSGRKPLYHMLVDRYNMLKN